MATNHSTVLNKSSNSAHLSLDLKGNISSSSASSIMFITAFFCYALSQNIPLVLIC